MFYGLILCFLWIFFELLSFTACRIRYGTLSSLQADRQQIIKDYTLYSNSQHTPSDGETKKWRTIHPYLGFVTEGIDDSRPCPDSGVCDQRMRTYEDLPFVKSTDDNLIVAIVGGSFAAGVSYGNGRGLVEESLRQIPRFKDKEVIVYKLAPGGYKQPQQLMKINYFLTLGAEFDMVINIDGFNEVAIPGVENLSKKVNPIFPRSWYYLVDSSLNPELLALYGNKENYRLKQFRWASFLEKPFIGIFPSTNLVWKFWNLRLMKNIKMADIKLVEYSESGDRKLQYATTGPDYHYDTWDDFYLQMSEIWARSSLQLASLCRGLGIEYYHFLQPNQYVEGSKPMLEKERKVALLAASKYGKAAAAGYPFLIDKGEWLRQKGVSFFDLTMMFSDTEKQLYIDNCCHLNTPGYGLVIREIARNIGVSQAMTQ